MYHPSCLSLQAQERTINRTQSGGNVDLRTQLENYRNAACNVVDQGTRASNLGMIERGLARLAEAEEQLTLLDAIEFGFIRPILGES
jgi:hypothetical protein